MVATLLIYGSHDNFVSLEEESYMHEVIVKETSFLIKSRYKSKYKKVGVLPMRIV